MADSNIDFVEDILSEFFSTAATVIRDNIFSVFQRLLPGTPDSIWANSQMPALITITICIGAWRVFRRD